MGTVDYVNNTTNDFNYCYDHMWRMMTFTSNQYYNQYCHNEFWFISLLVQLYIATPLLTFVSFSIYLPLSTSSCFKKTWITRYILVFIPIGILITCLNWKYNLNLNINSEMSLLTSHSTMGDYSLVYRGGISYLIGIIIYVMKMNKKYVANADGVISYDRVKNNGQDESKIQFNCCSIRIVIALLIIFLIIMSGTGTNYTFGNWNKQFKKWYDERDDKYIAVLKLLYFRTFFTIAVGVVLQHCLDVEDSILSDTSSGSSSDRMTMYARNN